MKKMKYYTEIWELKTLTFPLFRYYHIKVKAMNVHSKILFSWQRRKPTGWKASWGSSRIEIPTRAAYRKNPRAESMDLVGYDVSSLVTWVKSLIVNVKIIFIFHIRNLGGTADMNSSQWGEFVCAVFCNYSEPMAKQPQWAENREACSPSKHRRCDFANEALNSYNMKMQYTPRHK